MTMPCSIKKSLKSNTLKIMTYMEIIKIIPNKPKSEVMRMNSEAASGAFILSCLSVLIYDGGFISLE